MKRLSGFTVVEIMVALAVGILIITIGLPAFTSLMSSNQMVTYANDLVGSIRYARNSAANGNDSVTICASNDDQTGCSGTDWNNGWLVFVDEDDGNDLDVGEEILRVKSIHPSERSFLVFDSGTPATIRFNPSGENTAGTVLSLTFKKNNCYANQARTITVSVIGRPSIEHVACF